MATLFAWIAGLAGMAGATFWALPTTEMPLLPSSATTGGSAPRWDPRPTTDQYAEPLPTRELALGTNVSWNLENMRRPLRYRAGAVTLTIRAVASDKSGSVLRPAITIEAPGLESTIMEGIETDPGYDHMIGVGRLDGDGTPFVYYQGYSGGAHCCHMIAIAVIGRRSIEVSRLGGWDGGPEDVFPRDVDGDGLVDFVQRDDRFRYVFGGGADSYGPPQILNFQDRRIADVSVRPSFRRLYAEEMRRARQRCLRPNGDRPNGHCAVYVASAARVGRASQAWREMLMAYDPNSDIELPQGCRLALSDGEDCPPGAVIRFTNFPDALRYFLRAHGYLGSVSRNYLT